MGVQAGLANTTMPSAAAPQTDGLRSPCSSQTAAGGAGSFGPALACLGVPCSLLNHGTLGCQGSAGSRSKPAAWAAWRGRCWETCLAHWGSTTRGPHCSWITMAANVASCWGCGRLGTGSAWNHGVGGQPGLLPLVHACACLMPHAACNKAGPAGPARNLSAALQWQGPALSPQGAGD